VYIFEGSLYGPHRLTRIARTNQQAEVTFNSLNVYRCDVEATTNLPDGPWLPRAGLTNLPGDVCGEMTLPDTNQWPRAFYRVLRHWP
jgi:hypothetical protein